MNIKDNPPPLPEPAFRLNWHDDGARYTVSKPNIGSTDCYTEEQVLAAYELGRNAGLEEAAKIPRQHALELDGGVFGARFPDEATAIIRATDAMAEKIMSIKR